MGTSILSLAAAKRAAINPATHSLWIAEAAAAGFRARGWVRLEPPRNGGILFVHRERQQASFAALAQEPVINNA
jgi:hypothetical protein